MRDESYRGIVDRFNNVFSPIGGAFHYLRSLLIFHALFFAAFLPNARKERFQFKICPFSPRTEIFYTHNVKNLGQR